MECTLAQSIGAFPPQTRIRASRSSPSLTLRTVMKKSSTSGLSHAPMSRVFDQNIRRESGSTVVRSIKNRSITSAYSGLPNSKTISFTTYGNRRSRITCIRKSWRLRLPCASPNITIGRSSKATEHPRPDPGKDRMWTAHSRRISNLKK